MAIIKCPDCDSHVSDSASFCPNCGVRIANTLAPCPHCLRMIRKSENVCPHCSESIMRQIVVPEINSTSDAATNDEIKAENSKSEIVAQESSQIEELFVPTMNPVVDDILYHDVEAERVREQKDSRRTTYVIWGLIVLCLSAGGYFWYAQNSALAAELHAYRTLGRNSDLSDYRNFLSTYPHSKHSEDVRSLLDTLETEEREWNKISGSSDTIIIARYIAKYPNSRYIAECEMQLERLYWSGRNYQRDATGLRAYIRSYPAGQFVDEAKQMLTFLSSDTITMAEREIVKRAINSFTNKLASDSLESLHQHALVPMVRFMGKWGANLDFIAEYRKRLCPEGSTLSLSMTTEPAIMKIKEADGGMHYNTTYTLRQRVDYDNGKYYTKSYYASSSVLLSGKLSRFGMQQINAIKTTPQESSVASPQATIASPVAQ